LISPKKAFDDFLYGLKNISNMKANIVIPSFDLAHHANVIKKFNFIPSLLSTIYLSVIVLYQVAYSYIIIFQKKDEFF